MKIDKIHEKFPQLKQEETGLVVGMIRKMEEIGADREAINFLAIEMMVCIRGNQENLGEARELTEEQQLKVRISYARTCALAFTFGATGCYSSGALAKPVIIGGSLDEEAERMIATGSVHSN